MAITEQTLETLEFFRVCERLATYTSFSASHQLALELRPADNRQDVLQRLQLTSEARRLLDDYPQATIGGTRDIREAARHAARGGIIEASVLLEIANTLRSIRRLRGLLLKLSPEVFPLLLELAADLPDLPTLEDEIERTIGDDGAVLDSASAALGRLRREIRHSGARLQERLHNLVTSSQYAGVLQEPIVTVRAGRYVVPVRADKRRSLPGLVHDQSASGATLYVEPMAVVELNNQLREAQLAEEQEVRRILAALSGQVGSNAEVLVAGIETMALLDLAFAMAKYALALRCVAPEIIDTLDQVAAPQDQAQTYDQYPLLLTAARHPLLNQSSVVPINIYLGGSFRLLLITGPNTGGKTVALKTVGLLALMAQAGLHIPADEPCRLPVFAHVFADIGDEQSIEQSLSTFSSHMTNIIRILESIEEHAATHVASHLPAALVLLDELGAGTDPVEGAALARAISGRLLERGCLAICTTHYAELKVFAHNTPGVQNASVEFDIETLAPTYKLTIGLPGRSNALAIAARLGLDPQLVEQARGTLAGEEMQLESLLADIHREREAASEARQQAEAVRADAEKYRERYQEVLRDFEDTVQTRLEDVDRQLEHELRQVRAEMRRSRGDSPGAAVARQWAEEAEQHIQQTRSRLEAQGRSVQQAAAPSASAPAQQEPRPLKVGDTVQVRSLGLPGEILSIDEEQGDAEIQVGGFRVQADLRELRREKQPSEQQSRSPVSAAPSGPPAAPTRSVNLPAAPDVSMTFDMRGWRAADVSERLDRYLNDAYLAGLPSVRLVHGKGSGVLRQVVRDMLREHPLVASYNSGGSEGGDGVTVARLTER